MIQQIKAAAKAVIPEAQREQLKRAAQKARLFGLRYQCPFCNSHLKALEPFGYDFPVLREKQVIGGGYREEAQCPICLSLDRERLLYLYLREKTDFFSGKKKVLHVAPEEALRPVIEGCSDIDYLTADICEGRAMVQMDITRIDYPDRTFDVVICNHVLEHIPDDAKAMSELFRVIKPGGWGILQVPISLSLQETFEDFSVTAPSDREEVFGQSDHVRIYGADYTDRLQKAGFEVERIQWEDDPVFAPGKNRFGLLPNEPIFRVKKAVT